MKSASSTATYIVTGTDRNGADHTCSCTAAINGRMCWDQAAVVMARQRAEWVKAKRWAELATSASPVVTVPTHRAEAVLRFGGVEYRAEGRNLPNAIGNVARQREAQAA